jgi:two-component system phosphate regulon sensor histidine kinase PhoR
MAAVPLTTRGRILGVLEVSNKRDAAGYDEHDVQMLEALASLAGMASDNSHLLQQTDLIAEFMHEVKTPLMAVTAASELLARDQQGKKQVELIEMIQRETMRLSNMAQDFLDLSRLEAGRAQITREPVNLAEIIHDVVRLQEPQAAARDITFTVEVDGDLPVISGDYDRLRQVFLNLTSNAIKYNEAGGQIIVKASQSDEELQVEIADTGPGIATEYLPHLFERFYRIPDSEGFTKGTGLGLSIAARLLREHGGRIEVQSELGRGSTFTCFLPLRS